MSNIFDQRAWFNEQSMLAFSDQTDYLNRTTGDIKIGPLNNLF
jgi:hypothetical protein